MFYSISPVAAAFEAWQRRKDLEMWAALLGRPVQSPELHPGCAACGAPVPGRLPQKGSPTLCPKCEVAR